MIIFPMISPGKFLWDGCGAGEPGGALHLHPWYYSVQPPIPIDAILQDSAAPGNRPIHGTGSATTGMWAMVRHACCRLATWGLFKSRTSVEDRDR